jgi:hypothetical protein
MSDKQSLLQIVGALPENASWSEITNALLELVARRGTTADFARIHRTQVTAEQLEEYQNPQGDIPIDSVIAQLERRTSRTETPVWPDDQTTKDWLTGIAAVREVANHSPDSWDEPKTV